MAEHEENGARQDTAQRDRELLANRERMFGMFVRLSGWNVVLAFLVVTFLALTQT